MAVEDHGLEVLKKSGEEVTPGSKADYYIKVGLFGSFESPQLANAITGEYPDSVTEIYKYRQGGIAGTVLKTITVVYIDSTKELIQSVVSA